MKPIPAALHGRVFTREQALDAGVTDRMLEGTRFVRMHRSVYRTAVTEPTLPLRVDAALLSVGRAAAVSHTTNLVLRGLADDDGGPIHLATWRGHHRQLDGVVVHRYIHRVELEMVGHRPLTSIARTFVDCATLLSESELLVVGDAMTAAGAIYPLDLDDYCLRSHLDGVQRARRVAPYVRAGSASPMESVVRWWLTRDGLPEPRVNAEIYDEHGTWLARGDLVYEEYRLLVEYDGWHHERDAQQRQWDHLRREQLEAAGWRVIVVTVADLSSRSAVCSRVRQALRSRSA